MTGKGLRIGLVTPFSWAMPSAVNEHVADLAREFLLAGHQPVVLVSSDDPAELRRMRLLARRPQELGLALLSAWLPAKPPDSRLLPVAHSGPLEPGDGVPVIPLGRSFPIRVNGSVANIGLPVDVLSRLERVLVGGSFDVVHVHEPIAPSLSFTTIRETRSPLVSTFHLTPVGLLALEVEQGILQRFYDRLDGRIVPTSQAADVLRELYEGDYRVISPGTRLAPPRQPGETPETDGTFLYVYRGDDRRSLRAFLRAMVTALPQTRGNVVVAVHVPSANRWPPRPIPRRLRPKTRVIEFERPEQLQPLYQRATLTVLPFLGGEWLLPTALEAIACGCPIAAPDLPLARHLLGPDSCSTRFFAPGNEPSFLAALTDSRGEEPKSHALARAESEGPANAMPRIARTVLDVYLETLTVAKYPLPAGQRSAGTGTRGASPWRPASSRRDWIYVDLHVHSNYSKDSRSSVEAILATARDVGLGALAIADHNTIEGALAAWQLSDQDLSVIVAEEVKTQQGEVIGLFLESPIPRGLTFEETLSLIKEQNGLVYIPHPFDGLRATPSYRALVENLYRIDAIETYNARVALSSFNLNAERFAVKYNLPAGAGSDAHVLQGLGTAMMHMPRFDGSKEFMAALREADIVTRRKSLLYLQSLKLLQTTLDHVLPGG